MAEEIPGAPSGAVPPKPAEAAKVQPKKETVRINLPPKPTAAPNIKIPAPSAAPRPVAVSAPGAAPAAAPAAASVAPTPAPRSTPAPGGAARPQLPRQPSASAVSALDTGLAIAAAIASLAALVVMFIV
jgi:hypothetical protein